MRDEGFAYFLLIVLLIMSALFWARHSAMMAACEKGNDAARCWELLR